MNAKALLSLWLLCSICACSSPASPDKPWFVEYTFRIKGTITSSSDNSPVVANVDLFVGFGGWITSVQTNDQGQYSLVATSFEHNPREADFYLFISAQGFIAHTVSDAIRFTDEWQIINVQLVPET